MALLQPIFTCSPQPGVSQFAAGSNRSHAEGCPRPFTWQQQEARPSVRCHGIFSDLKNSLLMRLQGNALDEESSTATAEAPRPPVWPPPQEAEEEFEEKPYIPEVDEDASLDNSVLMELASRGSTKVRVDCVDKVVSLRKFCVEFFLRCVVEMQLRFCHLRFVSCADF